jgi:chromosome segregation ATPase
MEIQTEISLLDQRLSAMEDQLDGIKADIQDNTTQIVEINAKMSQILEALMGNPITNSKGMVGNLRSIRETVRVHDEKIKKFTWFWYGVAAFAGVIISIITFIFKNLIK